MLAFSVLVAIFFRAQCGSCARTKCRRGILTLKTFATRRIQEITISQHLSFDRNTHHSAMSYDPEGPIAQQLMPLLVNELTSTYNIPADAQDTAEYMNILIGQRRSAEEIVQQVKEVIDIPIDDQFVGRVMAEINRLQQLQNSAQPSTQEQNSVYQQPETQQQPQQPEQPQPPQHPEQHQQPQTQPFEFSTVLEQQQHPVQATPVSNPFPPAATVNPFGPAAAVNPFPPAQIDTSTARTDSKFPKGPLKGSNKAVLRGGNENRKNQRNGKGVGKAGNKDFVSGKTRVGSKSFGLQNAANLERALSLASSGSVNVPKGAKGGSELMEWVARSKPSFVQQPQVTLCRFGILCSKELCPFGHPTPANKDAKVIRTRWCRQNKNCTNPECEYAHSSPNYQAPPREPKPPVQPVYNPSTSYNTPRGVVPTSLEQCKFGLYCTNQMCTKRHALSQVPCKNGLECTRLDCSFNHPLKEDCKFGNECKSKVCYYRHPDGREKNFFNGTGGGNNNNSRLFAVPEDQVMEQVTQE